MNSQSGYRMRWERFDKAHPTYPQSLDASRLVLDFDDAERWSIPEGC